MKRALLGALVLAALVSGCGSSGVRPLPQAQPLHGVLVYAKAVPPYAFNSSLNVWRANARGGDRKILAENAQGPAVSPDGRYVAYSSGGKVFVVPAAGGKATALYTLGGKHAFSEAPQWAPDSRHLAFHAAHWDDGLVVIDVRSGKATTIKEPVDDFTFSPDSRRIAYDSNDDLYVMRWNGGTPVRLTDDHKSLAPVWGKTGIAFVRFTHDAHGEIWLTGARKHDARQLTHTGDYAIFPAFFSADGKELLAANPATHNGRLWAVDVPSGNARPLTPWVGDLFPQGLSRNGRTVLASIGCGGMIGPYGVVETIPFAGGKPHVIVHGPCRANWNAS
jgi:Tol biopolymer transport system component